MAIKKRGTKAKRAPKSKKTKRKSAKKAKKVTKKKVGKKVAPKKAVKAPKVKARKVFEGKPVAPKGAYLSKGELLNNFCYETTLTKKEGKAVFEALAQIGTTELQKRGKFVLPGMSRFVVKKRICT
jgi:hypothetical protein